MVPESPRRPNVKWYWDRTLALVRSRNGATVVDPSSRQVLGARPEAGVGPDRVGAARGWASAGGVSVQVARTVRPGGTLAAPGRVRGVAVPAGRRHEPRGLRMGPVSNRTGLHSRLDAIVRVAKVV
jgi:hypothetical protein